MRKSRGHASCAFCGRNADGAALRRRAYQHRKKVHEVVGKGRQIEAAEVGEKRRGRCERLHELQDICYKRRIPLQMEYLYTTQVSSVRDGTKCKPGRGAALCACDMMGQYASWVSR